MLMLPADIHALFAALPACPTHRLAGGACLSCGFPMRRSATCSSGEAFGCVSVDCRHSQLLAGRCLSTASPTPACRALPQHSQPHACLPACSPPSPMCPGLTLLARAALLAPQGAGAVCG